MHQYRILVEISNPKLLLNGDESSGLRQGVKGGLGLIDLQLPCKELLIRNYDGQFAAFPIKTIKAANPECYDIVYRISDRTDCVESALKESKNVVGILVENQENACLEAITKLKESYQDRVICAKDFLEAAVKLVCDYELNKDRRVA
ncbi:MAG: hypothetical protein QXT19_00150 [Candidatus Woesearchaeota archaeon]